MRFQFSLATLLVCMTVLAVVCAVAIRYPVFDLAIIDDPFGDPLPAGAKIIDVAKNHTTIERPPNATEIALRITSWGIPAVVATVAASWLLRRLKSRRENGPPVG